MFWIVLHLIFASNVFGIPSVVSPIPNENIMIETEERFELTVLVSSFESSDDTFISVTERENSILKNLGISDPLAPEYVSSENVSTSCGGISLDSGYIYFANLGNTVFVINVTDRSNLTTIGTGNLSEGISRDTFKVGSRCYVAVGDLTNSGVQALDITNKNSPETGGRYGLEYGANSVYAVGTNIFVTDGPNGLVIVDFSNIDVPSHLSTVDSLTGAHGVMVEGEYAYVADTIHGFCVVNVSNLLDPVSKGCSYPGESSSTTNVSDVDFDGTYGYLVSEGVGLSIYDVSNVSNPQQIGLVDTESSSAGRIYVQNEFAYVTDGTTGGIAIFDVSDKYNPSRLHQYKEGGILSDPKDISVGGNYIYIGDDDNGLVVLRFGDVIISGIPDGSCDEERLLSLNVSDDSGTIETSMNLTFQCSSHGECVSQRCSCEKNWEGSYCITYVEVVYDPTVLIVVLLFVGAILGFSCSLLCMICSVISVIIADLAKSFMPGEE